jgi:hypothetical protein
VYAVALRILIVWLYNNTGKSAYGSYYDPAVTGAIAVIAAAIVTFLWGSRTLARYRYA